MELDNSKILEMLNKADYGYYYDDNIITGAPPRCGKSYFKDLRGNCSDEIVKGSHERTSRIRALMQKRILVGSENFSQQYYQIAHEIFELMRDEHMAITDCSEHEANMFLTRHVDFNHVKKHVANDGKVYLSVDSKIGPKYEDG